MTDGEVEALSSQKQVDDAGTVSRSQIFIDGDGAICKFWSQFLAQNGCFDDGPIYVWADASPQLGTDWLLSVMLLIQASELPSCVSSFTQMASTLDEIQQADLGSERLVELVAMRHSCGETLSECFRMHRHVPMGLGSGASSVEHKVRCMLQKIFMESPSMPAVRAVLSRMRCFCVDMATELSMADMCGLDVPDLLPAWMRLAAPFDDDDQVVVQIDGGTGLSQYTFPLTFLSAGTVHICNNLSKDIDKYLTHWDEFTPGFKCLAFLIHHGWLRNRIIGRLLLGTPWEHLKWKLDKA